jgi:hypothetical protein
MPTSLVTWNMQGGNNQKWVDEVSQFRRLSGCRYICLQEVGTLPESAGMGPLHKIGDGGRGQYRVGTWNRWHLLFFEALDVLNPRCSLAILTKQAITPPPLYYWYRPVMDRPAIGVRVGNACYVCVHSRKGEVSLISHYFWNVLNHDGITRVFLAGDWNRPPNELSQAVPLQDPAIRFRPPNANTHNCKHNPDSMIDYLVSLSIDPPDATDARQGAVLDVHTSDHCPVQYRVQV